MWLLCIAILVTINISWCFQPPLRSLTGFKNHFFDKEKIADGDDPIEEQFFVQKLDHFNSTNDVVWNQRYWNNMKFAKSNGPQFLFMGQEEPSGSVQISVEALPHMIWAKNVSAGVWLLEHRYYGKSRPFEKQTTENLKYLSSRQYLADVANFIEAQNQILNLTNSNWVVFGGSYAGSLALWFRELYPDLAVGAVGSSAPIQPVLDFYEFVQYVESAITTRDPKCAQNIKAAFKALGNYMEFIRGRQKINEIFPNDDDLKMLNLTSDNIENFYLIVIDYFKQAVQYDCGTNCSKGINMLCKIMNNESSNALSNLGQVVANFSESMNFEIGNPHTYSDMVDYLKYDGYDDEMQAADRSWTWQKCNEFGFYTTTDGGASFFSSKVTTNLFIDICMDVFGDEYNVDHIKAGIASTLKLYGGTENYSGTNVVAPRGSVDPWSALALKASNDPSVIPYLIEGGTHCFDMYPPSDHDSNSLKNLRDLILENIQKWIGVSPIDNATTISTVVVHNEKQKKPFFSKVKWGTVSMFYRQNLSRPSHNFYRHRLLHRDIVRERLYANANLMEITQNLITQPVDHFNKTDARVWKQRFWNNSAFYQKDGPIFLMIGGEDDDGASGVDNENIPFLIWAKQHGADTYYIEHRGYGESLPATDPTVENLQYISSEQALADIANFIKAINEIRPNAKWITFGGSYPGSLSAWFREKYPELTVGAVASSAPLLPKIDYFEYLQVVENVIYEYNPKCGKNLKTAFADLEIKLYSIEGRREINKLFNVSLPGESPDIVSMQKFLENLINPFEGTVQGGYRLDDYCKAMTNDDNTPLENLASIESEETFDEPICNQKWNAMCSWTWQTCTEFGWYQTTDMGRNMFGAAIPLDYIINDCIKYYGKNITDVAAGVAYTLKNYGGWENYNATNVVLINGSHDPWHALGLYINNTSPFGITSILINGTSHCGDMYPPQSTDSEQLIAARKRINYLIKKWLK